MGNEKWFEVFSDVMINYLSEGDYDYLSGILFLENMYIRGKRFFRYFNMWKMVNGVKTKVVSSWEEDC